MKFPKALFDYNATQPLFPFALPIARLLTIGTSIVKLNNLNNT